MTMHRATVANGVHEILSEIAFPVVISSFGACEVTHRPKTAVGRVEVLATGVIALPSPSERGQKGPTRVDVPAGDISFSTAPSLGRGDLGAPAPTAVSPTDLLLTEQADVDLRAEGHTPEEGFASADGVPRAEEHAPAGAPQPVDTGSPRVEDVPLPEAAPQLHERIRAVLHRHEAIWSSQALGAIKAIRHHIELSPGAKPVRVPPRRAGPKSCKAEAAEIER